MPDTFPEELVIRSSDVLILADVHANFVDWEVMEAAVKFARELGIKKAAIVGDLIDAGAFSRHPPTWKSESVSKELLSASEVIRYLAKTCPSIYWCRGNHDHRVSVATMGQFDMDELRRLVHPGGKVDLRVTPYDRLWIEAATGRWLLAHPRNYSVNPLVLARQLSLKHSCHALVAHQHHHAMGSSFDGKYVVADIPPSCKPMAYKAMNTTKMPEWSPGFCALVKGRLVMQSIHLPYSMRIP